MGTFKSTPPSCVPISARETIDCVSPFLRAAVHFAVKIFSSSSHGMLYLDYRRRLVPDKWHGAAPSKNVHTKERCGGGGVSGHGCGLWKPKGGPCPHCQARPNRMQAKIAQAHHNLSDKCDKWGYRDPTPERQTSLAEPSVDFYTADGPRASLHRRSASRESLPNHTKERCGGGSVTGWGCGMWITKGRPCPYCARQPNREQAQAAQERQNQEELGSQVTMLRRESPQSASASGRILDKYSAGQPNKNVHTKERCGGGDVGGHGCGLWKPKGQPCPHCQTRPNRIQAKIAQSITPRVDMEAMCGGPFGLKYALAIRPSLAYPPSVRDDVEAVVASYMSQFHGAGSALAKGGTSMSSARPRSAPMLTGAQSAGRLPFSGQRYTARPWREPDVTAAGAIKVSASSRNASPTKQLPTRESPTRRDVVRGTVQAAVSSYVAGTDEGAAQTMPRAYKMPTRPSSTPPEAAECSSAAVNDSMTFMTAPAGSTLDLLDSAFASAPVAAAEAPAPSGGAQEPAAQPRSRDDRGWGDEYEVVDESAEEAEAIEEALGGAT